MNNEKILTILTNHRQLNNRELPRVLTLRSIVSLIEHSLPPNENINRGEIEDYLNQLQLQGEVLKAKGKKFCVAPPSVLVEDQNNCDILYFRGDRAYLKLVHQVLETREIIPTPEINSRGKNFTEIKEKLNSCGIRLLTYQDTLYELPIPQKPKLYTLEKLDNTLQGEIKIYNPSRQRHLYKYQEERWKITVIERLTNSNLIKLTQAKDYQYYWYEDNQFYHLTDKEQAPLTMFYLDKQANCPLQIPLDETKEGFQLNLQKVFIPYSYYKLVYGLSKPADNSKYIRIFDHIYRSLIEQIFKRLGCNFV
ncbi:hypothetical protein [Geminocystis herdmanii]|uniref:hypothetical protein n=1 Tax=Geminocystis herdmanii TaxID=669359 RepID=UPI0003463E03|nr:hypothetical protein [Geminocystis herdmanii]